MANLLRGDYLRACYETGFIAYPKYAMRLKPGSSEYWAWQEGWNDAQDLEDCLRSDLSRYMETEGV